MKTVNQKQNYDILKSLFKLSYLNPFLDCLEELESIRHILSVTILHVTCFCIKESFVMRKQTHL